MLDRSKLKKEGIVIDNYKFKFTEDETILFLETLPPTPAEKRDFIKKYPEIRDSLLKRGIRFVLDEPEIVDNKLIVAKGQRPKEGKPERIEFIPKYSRYTKFKDAEKKPALITEESKDLREQIQKILCVETDEVIAKWYPAILPVPGVNVWGEQVEPPPLQNEKTFELGENVYLDETTKEIKAKTDGVLVVEKGKINVLPEFTLKGDVDYSTGNIHFKGKKLTIIGDIRFGFKVHCKGDLEIKGCTENKVSIEVNGNLYVDGVIRGEETKVVVEGDAKIKGVEFAKLSVRGNLHIKDYLLFSETAVDGELYSTEGKGIVYGGKICVSGNVFLKIAGHPAQTKTEIFAGYRPEVVEKYLILSEKELILRETLTKILHGLELSKKLKSEGRLTPEKEKIVEKLEIEKIKISEKLTEIGNKLKLLLQELDRLRSSKIKIIQKIYPNVILGIAELRYTTASEITGPVTFYVDNTEIKYQRE